MATKEETTYQTLVKEGYTEEQIKLIMELGLFKPEEDVNERETEYANALRNPETPQGRRVGQDRLFIAANPLEHLAGLAGTAYGTNKQKGIDTRAKALAAEQVRRRIEFLKPRGAAGAAGPAAGSPVPGPHPSDVRGAIDAVNVAQPRPLPIAQQLRSRRLV